jgi:hypothetical protein
VEFVKISSVKVESANPEDKGFGVDPWHFMV